MQSACYSLSVVADHMMNKPEGVSPLDVWNRHAGSDIKKAAQNHGLLYMFSYFKKAVEKDPSVNNKEVIKNLCMLFGSSTIIQYSSSIIEGGFITPEQIIALRNFKEYLLEEIRPHLVTIIDCFLLPEQFTQSALISGDPYEVIFILFRTF